MENRRNVYRSIDSEKKLTSAHSHIPPHWAFHASLEHALDARVTIEQATGILMERMGCSANVAFEQLEKATKSTDLSLIEIAIRLVQSGAADADPDLNGILGRELSGLLSNTSRYW